MFQNSPINRLISSYEELKKFTKRHLKSQKKTYNSLENWSCEENNSAIQVRVIRIENHEYMNFINVRIKGCMR
jgi:hypothetical protein